MFCDLFCIFFIMTPLTPRYTRTDTLLPDATPCRSTRPGGWCHREFATAIADAVGRKARSLPMPAPLLTLGAAIDTGWARLNRRLPKLSFDRARYFCHPDWVATAERRPDAAFWSPDRKSTRLNSSHLSPTTTPSSALKNKHT